jgi:hypothetical protein
MSYNNAVDNSAPRENVGLDKVLNSLYADFNEVSWLTGNVFLRGVENKFPDMATGEMRTTPEMYIGNGEYLNLFFNDNKPCTLFFKADGEEVIDFERPERSRVISFQRPMSLILSCDLRKIRVDYPADYVFTEQIKKELLAILSQNENVFKITRYCDEGIAEVFTINSLFRVYE